MGIRIFKTPQRSDVSVIHSVDGEILTVNNETFDLSSVGVSPVELKSEFVVGPVFRVNGDVCVQMVDPYRIDETPGSPETMPEPERSMNPVDYTLTAIEFDSALIRLGIDRDDVTSAIKSIFADDIEAKAEALSRWWNLRTINRDNQVMAILKPVFGVTDDQIDSAWMTTVNKRNS
jgi:hypothetical protein